MFCPWLWILFLLVPPLSISSLHFGIFLVPCFFIFYFNFWIFIVFASFIYLFLIKNFPTLCFIICNMSCSISTLFLYSFMDSSLFLHLLLTSCFFFLYKIILIFVLFSKNLHLLRIYLSRTLAVSLLSGGCI